MTCDETREILPAYAISLLNPVEVRSVEEHLAECPEHEAELIELRATAFALDLLREDAPAPASLRRRVRALTASPSGDPSPRAPSPRAPSALGSMPPRRPWWLAAAAVVALVAVFAAGWATHTLLDDGSSTLAPPEVRYAYALQGASGEFVSFTGVEGSDKVTVKMAGLARLGGDQRYRLWAIRDGRWERIGQCNTNAQGGWVGDFAFALRAGEQLAVTIEQTSADPQPPTDPILRTSS